MSVHKHLCGPCLAENIEKKGVVYCKDCEEPFCEQCYQDHARIKVSRFHKLYDIAKVPPQEIQDLLKSLTACPNHEKEEVVYLCKDHDVTCCSKCAMVYHRKCEEVKVLSDILHGIKVDCSGLKTVLRQMQHKGESLLEHERKHEEMIAETERKATSLLHDLKQKLLDKYTTIEKTVLSSIADKKRAIFEKSGAQRESICSILKDIEQHSSFIEQLEKFGTEDHVMLLQRKIVNETQPRLQSSLDGLDKSQTSSSFQCTENTHVDALLINIGNSLRIDDTVCDVSETGSDSDIKQITTYTEQTLELQSEIFLLQIPNTCVLIDHHMVISFDKEPCLIVYHEGNKTVLSKFNCQSIPCSVSKTGQTDMVISLPRESKIAFAQLRNGNVHFAAEMTTSVPYSDVVKYTHLEQYICLSRTNGQIHILNYDGSLLQSLNFSPDMIQCIKSSVYLALHVNSGLLILSKSGSNGITAINLQGNKVYDYKHKNLSGSRQCAVDPCGNLYVPCSFGVLQQISPTGQYIKSILLRDVDQPRGLCFNDTFDKLAIVGGRDKCYLRLYKFI
ncbi:hypothetical protein DPMN_156377 [Dreissena polymorpha]|uniref:B box-type domain-containing protein n=1 Tax=Dreissena polymorpha TaxID=45954 RepID=A0A9D4JBT2_DREPO|nr:hypothetical protein DPMN_156377 [Dreissena polymorpha]